MQGESNNTNEPRDADSRADEGGQPDPAPGDPKSASESSGDPLTDARAETAKMKDAWLRTAPRPRGSSSRGAPRLRQPRTRHPERSADQRRQGDGRWARHGAASVRRG